MGTDFDAYLDNPVNMRCLLNNLIALLLEIRNGRITLDHLEWFTNLNKDERDALLAVSSVKH